MIRTSGFPRTTLSAQALLHGLYPELTNQSIGEYCVPIRHRYHPVPDKCPRLAQLFNSLHNSEEFQAPLQTKAVKSAWKVAEELAPETKGSRTPWLAISDTIKCIEEAGLSHTIPDAFAALCHRLALLEYWKEATSTPEIMRLSIGLLLHEILQQMDFVVGNMGSSSLAPKKNDEELEEETCDREKLRCTIFVAHDSSLVPILKIMRLYDGEWPPFAGNIYFHLSDDRQQQQQENMIELPSARTESYGWSVTIVINDKPKAVLPYSEFRELIAPYCLTDSDYEKQCKLRTIENVKLRW